MTACIISLKGQRFEDRKPIGILEANDIKTVSDFVLHYSAEKVIELHEKPVKENDHLRIARTANFVFFIEPFEIWKSRVIEQRELPMF